MLIFKSRIKNIEDTVTIQGIVFKNFVMLKFYRKWNCIANWEISILLYVISVCVILQTVLYICTDIIFE